MENSISRDKFKEKLKGREAEFATYTAEAILMDPLVEDLEFDIHVKDRLDRYSKEQLVNKLTHAEKILSDLYTCLHSWGGSCTNSHQEWKNGAIDDYEAAIKNNIISDKFGLYNDEVEINLGKYKQIVVHEPREKVVLDYTYYTSGRKYSTYSDLVPELILIRSYTDSKMFYILHNSYGPMGCLTKINEGEILAIAAKNKLLGEGKDE